MIKVLLVEDHNVVRAGLSMLINNEPDLEIAGEAATGLEILTLLDQGLKADILITDISMPEMDGIQLMKELKEHDHGLKVIFLSMYDSPEVVVNALRTGAAGYLTKSSNTMELIFAIRHLYSGGQYISTDLQFNFLDLLKRNTAFDPATVLEEELTTREIEVLRLIAEGYSNVEIAKLLFLSKRTVEGHRYSLLTKTNSRNGAQLVKMAFQMKLL